MADGGGQGLLSREVPSVALDQLFLEFHDQLPKESRERFAQLADEVKRLTESSTTEAPVTAPSSTDQAPTPRKEETTEAKQSSVELQARGKAYNFTAVVQFHDEVRDDSILSVNARIISTWL